MSRKVDHKLRDGLFRNLAGSLIITVQIKYALQGCLAADYSKNPKTLLTTVRQGESLFSRQARYLTCNPKSFTEIANGSFCTCRVVCPNALFFNPVQRHDISDKNQCSPHSDKDPLV